MSETIRVAVASSDGRSIDQHFGWATQFYVYDVTGDDATLVEVRPRPGAGCGGESIAEEDRSRPARAGHLIDSLRETAVLLEDCAVLLVTRIGEGPAVFLAAEGLRIFEVNIPVDSALQKLGKAGAAGRC